MSCMQYISKIKHVLQRVSVSEYIVCMAFFLSFVMLFISGTSIFSIFVGDSLNNLYNAVQGGISIYPSLLITIVAFVVWFIVLYVLYIVTNGSIWYILRSKQSISKNSFVISGIISLVIALVTIIRITDVPYVESTLFFVVLLSVFSVCMLSILIYTQFKKWFAYVRSIGKMVAKWQSYFFYIQIMLLLFSILFLFLTKVSPYATKVGVVLDIILFLGYVFVLVGVTTSIATKAFSVAALRKITTYISFLVLLGYLIVLVIITFILRFLPSGDYVNFIFWFIGFPFGFVSWYIFCLKEAKQK
jgi:hypothetical protein